MKKLPYFAIIVFFLTAFSLQAQEIAAIKLNPPDTSRGLPFMKALSVKASATEWSSRELTLQDLSDLLWAANGLNRPDENKTTASSAMNAHDVDIYVFLQQGVFVYDFIKHELTPVLNGDFRSEIFQQQRPARDSDAAEAPSEPPIQTILISDVSRFPAGTPQLKYEWGAIDTGIISQNISLFCAATGLKTRPRASMDREKIKQLLQLTESQYVFLNHPVGYAK